MKNLICMICLGSLLVLGTSRCADAQTSNGAGTATQENKTTPTSTENLTEMPWVSLNEVEALMKKNPKKLIVDVYTPWCGPCKMMDQNTFTDPGIIQQMGKHFYPIKFNAEGPDPITFLGQEFTNPQFDPNLARGRNAPHQLSGFFAVRGYPSLVVMDEQFKIIGKIVGYLKPEQLKVELDKYMN